jgi:hypothetical protein
MYFVYRPDATGIQAAWLTLLRHSPILILLRGALRSPSLPINISRFSWGIAAGECWRALLHLGTDNRKYD